MTCQLPEEKLTSIKSLGEEVSSREWVTIKTLQRLLGRIISTRPAVQMSRARSRGIQRLILDNYRDRSSAKKLVRLTAWAREDINWWRKGGNATSPTFGSILVVSYTLTQKEDEYTLKFRIKVVFDAFFAATFMRNMAS